ncbi:MAG: hypothetical protein OXE42_01825 [Gammaproteobacteria bacterium]|nr:hypothetical protein [Gammaproteobacteria bacterium]
MRVSILLPVVITSCLFLCACDRSEAPQGGSTAGAAGVSDERLVNADAEPHNWLNHGRTWRKPKPTPSMPTLSSALTTRNICPLA